METKLIVKTPAQPQLNITYVGFDVKNDFTPPPPPPQKNNVSNNSSVTDLILTKLLRQVPWTISN